jgi:hypothetical protein
MEGEIREIPVEPIRDDDHAKITASQWCLKMLAGDGPASGTTVFLERWQLLWL